jgi:tetratricopeptide (TPR) repeat protein
MAACGCVLLKAWLVDQTLDAAVAVALLGALCFLTASVMYFNNPAFNLIWSLILVTGCSLLGPLSMASNKRALNRIRRADIEKYLHNLQFDPLNASTHKFLADAYMDEGRYEEAIAAYKEAIRLQPHDVQAIRRKLNHALDVRDGADKIKTDLCPHCQWEMPVLATHCDHCGGDREIGFIARSMKPEIFRPILQNTVFGTLAVIAVLTVLSAFEPLAKACIIIAAAAVGVIYFWRNT